MSRVHLAPVGLAPVLTLVRVRNWDVALAMRARELVGRPFEWGRTDCGTLCREALDALYGPGTGETLLGPPWTSPRAARSAAERLEALIEVLRAGGARLVGRLYASAGDIVIRSGHDEEGLPRLAVVIGPKVLHVTREHGVVVGPVGGLEEGDVVLRLPGGTPGGAPGGTP